MTGAAFPRHKRLLSPYENSENNFQAPIPRIETNGQWHTAALYRDAASNGYQIDLLRPDLSPLGKIILLDDTAQRRPPFPFGTRAIYGLGQWHSRLVWVWKSHAVHLHSVLAINGLGDVGYAIPIHI